MHAEESLQVLVQMATGLGFISSMRIDGRKDIQSVKSYLGQFYIQSLKDVKQTLT